MSIPKHDPSLAKFLSTLDPSMYTISGGDTTTSEVKGLREDLESRYRESNLREESRRTPRNTVPAAVATLKQPKDFYYKHGKKLIAEEKFRKSPAYKHSSLHIEDEFSSVLTALFFFVVAIIILILILR